MFQFMKFQLIFISIFFQPSRVLTPPPMQTYTSYQDQNGFASDYNYYASHSNYWDQRSDYSASPASDVYPEESASYVTIIRPKTNPNPYSSTIYNKNVRNNIYHLAANVNSLEPVDKKPYWVHSLLQKEITYQPETTTPQVIVAFSPKIVEPIPIKFNHIPEALPNVTPTMDGNSFAEPTTAAPVTSTTESAYSRFTHPVIPERIPERIPMFLIIQGHSKVKTYGPDSGDGKRTEKNQVKMVPVSANADPIVQHVVSMDRHGSEIQVKHLHKLHTPAPKTRASAQKSNKKAQNSAMDSLLSLLDGSLANFGLNDMQTNAKANESKKTNEKATIKSPTILGPVTIRPLESNFDS